MEKLRPKAKEGDVETRVVLPLLSSAEYLAIPRESIRSKAYLQPQQIDKAAGKTTGYYPDFSVWEDSFPLVIVEAKAPSVAAEVGYREASQYALHLNRQYRSDMNPCGYLIATNGQRILAGYWNANPEIDADVEEIRPGSSILELLKERAGHAVLKQRGTELRHLIASDGLYYATKGSQSSTLINSKVPPNRFAAALIPTLTRYFASPADDSDPAVYDAGYVPTNDNETYDSILEGLLKEKAHAHRNPFSKDLVPTDRDPKDFSKRIVEYKVTQRNTPQILLVLGHVGAGKSLFIRRYRELLVPSHIKGDVYWSFINFNDAPPNLLGAEEWVSRRFVESFAEEQPDIDLYDLESVEHLFAVDINSQRSVYQKLATVDPADAEREKAADLKRWLSDPQKLSRGITRHFEGDRGGVCIAVFDNVDKLNKDDQLSVFQLALGFTTDHRTLTILQLRDETFERYKDTKPLDTFKTGVSFHIRPPRFANVVRKRLEITFKDLNENAPKSWEYDLSNGARVRISKEQALAFLSDIYEYVFGADVNASRILQGLAGRDVRRALDIFFRVMISGHLASEQITSMGIGGTSFPITDDLVLRTLMRGDYLSADMADFANAMFSDSVGTGGLSRTRKAQGVQSLRKYIRELRDRRAKIAPNLVGVPSAVEYLLLHIEKAIAEAIKPLRPLPITRDDLDL